MIWFIEFLNFLHRLIGSLFPTSEDKNIYSFRNVVCYFKIPVD